MKRLNKVKHALGLAWLLIAWMTMAAHEAASAQGTARVYLTPADSVLAVGDTTTLTIRVAGAADLYGYELHLLYDPVVLQVLDADPSRAGVQLAPGDMLDPDLVFTVANSADNQTGTLDYAITLLAPAEAVAGDGILASFNVRALADGSSQLTFSAILASAEGVSLPVTVEGGRLAVGSGVGRLPSATPTSAASRVTSTPQAATATSMPTATGRPLGQTPERTPVVRQPSPTTSQLTPGAGQPAPETPGALPATGQPDGEGVTESIQAMPDETADALAALATSPVGAEDQPASGDGIEPRPSVNAVPIASPSSDWPAESRQNDNSILAGGLVLVAFLLLALLIFFGRRLLSHKL